MMPGLRLEWRDDVPAEECDHDTADHPRADAVCWICGGLKHEDDDGE